MKQHYIKAYKYALIYKGVTRIVPGRGGSKLLRVDLFIVFKVGPVYQFLGCSMVKNNCDRAWEGGESTLTDSTTADAPAAHCGMVVSVRAICCTASYDWCMSIISRRSKIITSHVRVMTSKHRQDLMFMFL